MSPTELLLVIVVVWTFALAPIAFLEGVRRFMDLMRRKHDNQPW